MTTAARERQRWSDPSFWSLWAPPSAAAGAKDTLLLFARADDCALLIALPSDQSFDLASSERNLLLRVVHHIEAGLRLRMGSPRRRMVLRPNGELARDSSPPASEPFRRVTRTEGEAVAGGSPDGKLGTSSDNEPLSAPETWLALTEGHLAVVPRTDGQGERHYVFCETDRRPLCALSRAEIQVVAHAARGLSNKLIAHELGVSESFVSRALGRATFRLGCTSRHDLVRMAALLLGPPPERGRPEGLTAAECEVLEMVRSGHSNAEIAAQRATSPRTVANQIARVLRKLGASSRRQVALG
ncbi:MAG TPA: helix-turn-helix transcriptional regulator [Polyangiaceae bacterium]|nr:helix-turn-helix transcriptional regulator [Polyangiaceae bacterium]